MPGIGIGFSPGHFGFKPHRRFDGCRRQYLRLFLPSFIFDPDADSDADPDLKLTGGVLIKGKFPASSRDLPLFPVAFVWIHFSLRFLALDKPSDLQVFN
jgi:hypothetical protein